MKNTKRLFFDLVAYRRRNGLTQIDVATTVGLTQSAISQFENNNENVKLTTINYFADKLGVDASELVSIKNY